LHDFFIYLSYSPLTQPPYSEKSVHIPCRTENCSITVAAAGIQVGQFFMISMIG
jgi:hypothetical protein